MKISIALVKFSEDSNKAYMFEYPNNKNLNKGDIVLVEDNETTEKKAIVVETIYLDSKYSHDTQTYNRLLMLAGIDKITKKVIARLDVFKYEEAEDED